MKFHWHLSLVFVLSITISSTLAARRLTFRPLSAQEVYRILKDAGREDAVPEGRIVTQGIAAISGFALGLKSGLAVPLAIGLATSNVTQDFINNINYTALTSSLPTIPPFTLPTINYTALTAALPTIPPLPTINYTALTSSLPTINVTALTSLLKGSSSGSGSVQYTTQEICFNSRSLNEINDEDYENDDAAKNADNDYDENDINGLGRQAPAPGTATGTATGVVNTETGTANSPTGTAQTSPDQANTDSATGSGTNQDQGDNSMTNSVTSTVEKPGAVNCVVIQKPVVSG